MIYILFWLQASTAGEFRYSFFRHGQGTCAALLQSIALDTTDYGLNPAPGPLALRLIKGDSEDLFLLSRRVWEDAADRGALRELAAHFKEGTATTADEEQLRERRARLKNVRFAFAMFDREHGEGEALNALAKAMGQVRDGHKTDTARWLRHGARELEEALTREAWQALHDELDGFRVARPAELHEYQVTELARLGDLAGRNFVTAADLHEMRKIVARFGAMYGLLRARVGTARVERAFRHLSTLNGRMGALHDELVAMTARGELDYRRDGVSVPPELRTALLKLTP